MKCPNCNSKINQIYEFYYIYDCGSIFNTYIRPPENITLKCSHIRLKNSIIEIFECILKQFKFK